MNFIFWENEEVEGEVFDEQGDEVTEAVLINLNEIRLIMKEQDDGVYKIHYVKCENTTTINEQQLKDIIKKIGELNAK